MSAGTDLLGRVPRWLLRTLPANAAADEALEQRVDELVGDLPGSFARLTHALAQVRAYREYDSAANRASAHAWLAMEGLLEHPSAEARAGLLDFAAAHMVAAAQARIFRRLVRDPNPSVRRKARRLIERARLCEVALPSPAGGPWDTSGWLRGARGGRLFRHLSGRPVQMSRGLPEIRDLGELRQVLGIKSPRQLGYLLVASDAGEGPYVRFVIPKRDGSQRVICAPKAALRWAQRRVLRKILDGLPVHDAAHGFVRGRSTVTNAAQHRGARVLVKFDLENFFPTIHYYRVMGLFTSLGYTIEDGRFGCEDRSRRVAPTLARLCTYTPDPRLWGVGALAQGAPTSPAISNLVCRGLDARLTGLARKCGATYTRYADDLTFSFRSDAVELGRFRWWVDQICHQEGFLVNQRKFRVIRASQRQTVTGIVVNDELRVPRGQRRRFRAMLHNCRRHGLASQARGNPAFADYLRGFASYLHMVHPEGGTEALRQLEALLDPGEDGGREP